LTCDFIFEVICDFKRIVEKSGLSRKGKKAI